MTQLIISFIAAWAALLFGGWLLGPERHMPTWTRMASSTTLVLLAWLLVGRFPGTFSLLLAIGMTLGLIGDLSLGQVLPVPQPFLVGMGAFGVGHVAYIAGLLQFGSRHHWLNGNQLITICGSWWLIALVGWYVIVYRGNAISLVHWLALPYALLLTTTAACATVLALHQPHLWLTVVGSVLFLGSDLLVAAGQFRGLTARTWQDVVWLTYGPAQLLIVLSTIWAR